MITLNGLDKGMDARLWSCPKPFWWHVEHTHLRVLVRHVEYTTPGNKSRRSSKTGKTCSSPGTTNSHSRTSMSPDPCSLSSGAASEPQFRQASDATARGRHGLSLSCSVC